MNLIQGITDDPIQHTAIVLVDGTKISLTLTFDPLQQGWFADLVYTRSDATTWTLNGEKFVSSPNLLRQFRNLIPFGLMIVTNNGMDPLNLEDFEDGTATVYLLEASDITAVEAAVYPGR